ncbi:cytochrome c-type biogenesis protein CcmH [Pelagibacterium flavum]|uniref:Cytochrome c-type biogenesis protein n=1 Tax=Pelagibacterium flavum TaxID=2984530 RepID=A0ABY6IU25_9HYPH|nr:cytochrome c-type biogenesis protein [Pelagibacterium sp. YIM 151497]MAN76115.1 cytochrome C biogenesis protein [Hyphomicrobiales bacterium]UYQ74132.1 cytochrome c-type biogenesis protein CcmH [Pelagibacterium sp. YIM 151497]
MLPMTASAVQPDEVLDNPVLEQRARSISGNLRCLVCQNQSIDDSDAELARDLRLLVRERLVAGDTDTEVYDFVVARYGEFVLLNPVFGGHTVFLWVATPILLGSGLIVLAIWAVRRRKTVTGKPGLSSEEEKALERLRKS